MYICTYEYVSVCVHCTSRECVCVCVNPSTYIATVCTYLRDNTDKSVYASFLYSALLFSATFRKKVEKLCRDVLTDPVRILVGELGEANTDITQLVEVIDTEDKKWQWLSTRLVEFTSSTYVCMHVYVLCVYCVYACVCMYCVRM